MLGSLLERAHILLQQQRYADAEKVLKQALALEPDNSHTILLLSEVYIQLDKYELAEPLIDGAIINEPDRGVWFFLKGRIAMRKERYDQAEEHLETAVTLDPVNPDFHALWASIKLGRKQFGAALEKANKSLELDPENILALNIRSSALLKLKRSEESFQTIEGALREDPNNPYTHSNYGWNLLEQGDHKKALIHFREALKNDPGYESAQSGMVQALKANNIFYRGFLKYQFFMGNLTARYQWFVIIGLYLLVSFLRILSDSNKALKPFIIPVIVLFSIFALSTWVMRPISNLFLRLNSYGKYLLSKEEIISSNFVGGCLFIFLLGLTAFFITDADPWIVVSFVGFAMMVPCSMMMTKSKIKNAFLYYMIFMALLGVAGIFAAFTNSPLFSMISIIFFISFIAFQWIANFLMIRSDNR